MKRLPIWFAIGGAVLKTLLLIEWYGSRSTLAFGLLTSYDPVSYRLAQTGANLIFRSDRIMPTPPESVTFELFLVLGFSLQCLLLGIVVQSMLRSLKWRSNQA